MSEQQHPDDAFPQVPGSGPEPQSQTRSAGRTPPPPPPPNVQTVPVYMPAPAPPPRARRSGWAAFGRFIMTLIVLGSLGLNIYLLGRLGLDLGAGEAYRPGNRLEKIAIIPLEGVIEMEAAADLREMLRWALQDDDVKGVILAINSPGGAVVPSDMMATHLESFRQESGKPVYACVLQIGASGAYWACAGADRIYAQENARVGSIGVLYMNFVVEEALKEKLGVMPVVVKSTRSPAKDLGSSFRMPSEEELREIQGDLDTIHARFVEAVSAGRGLDTDTVWNLADGDVHFGPEAVEMGLVDAVGTLDGAIDDLALELKLSDPMVVYYQQPESFWERLGQARSRPAGLDLRGQIEQLICTPRIMALWLGE